MYPDGAETVLVRHGEIGVKSAQVQTRMIARLRNNIDAVLADRGVDATIDDERTRLYVRTTDVEAATAAVTDVPGVVSASPALRVDPTMAAIEDALDRATREHYDGGTFAVDARRAGETDAHPFTSKDVEEQGGAAVWEAAEDTGTDPTVDLENPDQTFYVEVRQDDAYLFLEKRAGPGGLPLGTQRPLVALISGGIDSPVAAWEAMTRGAPVYPLYVDLGEYGGPDHRARAERTAARLQHFAPNFDLTMRMAPGGQAMARLSAEMDELRMLSLRRFMYRVAEGVADDLNAVGIVSGEAIGQKSSQTSVNLAVTSAATDLPIHRPLLTVDKTEITERAREIGTFEDATVPAGCNRLAPSFPVTAASLDAVRDAEPDDLFDLAEETAEAVEVLDPHASTD